MLDTTQMEIEGKKVWKYLSIISYIGSLITCIKGLDKMYNYVNSEYSWIESHNAYVGGDAYNYIINGNYATGFFVLATMFALMGVGFIVVYYQSKIANTVDQKLSRLQRVYNELPKRDDNKNTNIDDLDLNI